MIGKYSPHIGPVVSCCPPVAPVGGCVGVGIIAIAIYFNCTRCYFLKSLVMVVAQKNDLFSVMNFVKWQIARLKREWISVANAWNILVPN